MTWCSHPLTIDLLVLCGEHGRAWTTTDRVCLTCGVRYDRGAVLERLRDGIRERHRLPPSPWSAAERSQDTS